MTTAPDAEATGARRAAWIVAGPGRRIVERDGWLRALDGAREMGRSFTLPLLLDDLDLKASRWFSPGSPCGAARTVPDLTPAELAACLLHAENLLRDLPADGEWAPRLREHRRALLAERDARMGHSGE